MARRPFWRFLQDESVEERVAEGGLYIVLIGTALALLFTWLTLQDLPYADAIANAKREYVQRVTLVIFYLSWVAGTKYDLEMQKSVYLLDPNRGSSRLPAITVAASIFVAFVVLLFVKDDQTKFAIALAGFIAINVLSWQFFVRKVIRPIIDASRGRYEKEGDYLGLERLNVMERYIAGNWQWARFAIMVLLMAAAAATIVFAEPRAKVSEFMHRLYSSVPADKIDALLAAALIALLICVAEAWIWIMRLRTRHSLHLLDTLGRSYQLAPLPKASGKQAS